MKFSATKPTLDAILVSDAKIPELQKITQQAIDSIGPHINVIVIESNKDVIYKFAHTIHPEIPFNYNSYLNLGAKTGNAEYIFFGNNDLIFTKYWDKHLINELHRNNADSASPLCPKSHSRLNLKINSGVYPGHSIFSRFCGWAFLWSRQLYQDFGGLDEDFVFWCSDNAAVEQLIKNRKKHILVTSSVVHHLNLGNNTINLLDKSTVYKYTIGEIEKYNKKFNRNLRVDDSWDLPEGLRD